LSCAKDAGKPAGKCIGLFGKFLERSPAAKNSRTTPDGGVRLTQSERKKGVVFGKRTLIEYQNKFTTIRF